MNKDIIIVIPKGEKVSNYGNYTSLNGVKWLLVTYGKYTGFISMNYLTRMSSK